MALEMKKRMFFSLVLLFALLLGAFFVAPTESYAFEITIDVAPNILNIQSQGEVVTVHTDIAYGAVDPLSITLIVEGNSSGVAISSWKADDRGYFVAKFLMYLVKDLDLEINEYNTFTIEGWTEGKEEFWGSQDILVINNVPQNR
jgi:hypothetical protein